MFPAARLTDPITHDMITPCGVIAPGIPPCPQCGSAPVIIEGLPAAHVLCTCACTGVIAAGIAHPPPPGPPLPIPKGSATVFIHSMPAVRWSPAPDMGACGVFLGNPAMIATRKVLIGDVGMGGVVSTQGQAMQRAKEAAQPFCEICTDA